MFIIIGIVVLLSSALFFYAKSSQLGPFKPYQGRAGPVEQFIDQCVSTIARQAINLAANQGGYVTLPQRIDLNPALYLVENPGVPRDIALRVPYWYYEGKTRYPTQTQVEAEIEGYIVKNIDSCLQNFSAFRDEYVIEEKSVKQAVVALNREDVTVQLNYLVDITPRGGNETTSRQAFTVSVPVPLLRLYNLAVDIAKGSAEQSWFETFTIDIAALMPTDQFPFSDFTLLRSPKRWFTWEIRENLQDILAAVYPGVRVVGTNYLPFLEDERKYEKYRGLFENIETVPDNVIFKDSSTLPFPLSGFSSSAETRDADEILRSYSFWPKEDAPEDAYAYFHYRLDPKQEHPNDPVYDYSNIKVSVQYKPDWGMNFVARPSKNGVLQPIQKDITYKLLSFLSINYYFFNYDIQYPILITLNDPTANNGQGQVFKFALPVLIKGNEPDKTSRVEPYYEPSTAEPGFCDPSQRIGDEVHLFARDAIYHIPLDKVNMTYICLEESCNLGQTKPAVGTYRLDTTLPQGCFGGVILAEREGYLPASAQLYGDELYLDLYPLAKVPVDIRKIRTDEINYALGTTIPRFLQPGERAVITLETQEPTPHSVFLQIDGTGRFNTNNTIDLIFDDGITYDLSIYLFDQNDVFVGGFFGNFTPELSTALSAQYLELQAFEISPKPTNSDEDLIRVFDFLNNKTNNQYIKHTFKP